MPVVPLRSLAAAAVLPLLALPQLAAQNAPRVGGGAVALRQACLDATTDALVLNLAAHPDDEADRTLTWFRHKLGLRTVTLYSTWGRGGQNAVGREIGPALGRIRVRKTLAAAQHTGVEVRWLGFPDFGYSKTVGETLDFWGGRPELVRRLAAVVDELQPDLVFTNHGTVRGHGHHRATAVAIRDVLRAGDTGRPRTAVLYERVFGKDAKPDWECDPFELDVVRGESYARQASRGRREHRTQGPWGQHDPTRRSTDRWRRVDLDEVETKAVAPAAEASSKGAGPHVDVSAPAAPTLAADPLTLLGSLTREPAFVETWSAMGHDVAELDRTFAAFAFERSPAEHVAAAQRLLPRLRAADERLPGTDAGERARRRLHRRVDSLQRILLAGAGIDVEAYLERRSLVYGGTGKVVVLLHAVEPGRVGAVTAMCRGASAEPMKDGEKVREGAWKIAFPLPTAPADEGAAASPFEPTWVDVEVALSVDGVPIALTRSLAVDLRSPLELEWDQQTVMVSTRGGEQHLLSLDVRYRGAEEFSDVIELELPEGLEAELLPAQVALSAERPQTRVLVRLAVPGRETAGTEPVRARLGAAAAELAVVHTGIEVDPALRLGLVRGPDDTLQRALEDLQIPFQVLDETVLAVTDLGTFDTVVLDIRAYHHRPDLAQHRERLLRFCAGGGRVLSFYHKPREWNARDGHPLLAPFPLAVGRARVSEEDARIELLQPEHQLWTRPHAITAGDFDGWVQERGLNFPSKWEEPWQPLIAMADKGEDVQRGGLLYAKHEKGDFVYCSLALYRQLRVGHIGAARILLNLLTP